jgi:hypothetical protein
VKQHSWLRPQEILAVAWLLGRTSQNFGFKAFVRKPRPYLLTKLEPHDPEGRGWASANLLGFRFFPHKARLSMKSRCSAISPTVAPFFLPSTMAPYLLII